MKPLYIAVATVRGGRDGHASSSDGALEVDLRTPKEMGGTAGPGTNPEQLFAAGYAACFESAMELVARREKKTVTGLQLTAEVALNRSDEGKYLLSVRLRGKAGGQPADETLALMRAAHEVCPYSNATRGNIEVELSAE